MTEGGRRLAATMRDDLPTGTVTFVFTDIEGSTRLGNELAERFDAILLRHHQLIRDVLARHGGIEVSTEGDAFFAVFPSAPSAVAAVAEAQQSLAAQPWPDAAQLRVRMGLHTGDGRLGGDNYVGTDVNRAARIAAAAHGGQVLLSDATRALVGQRLPAGVAIRDLGRHRLKDLPEPDRIWQLEIDGLTNDFPEIRSLDARPNNLPLPAASLVGRTAELAAIADLVRERRLVTLTGPGGTGKTRVALAAAHHLLAEFTDGAYFVALQDAWDRPAVAAATALALGVREKYDRELEQGVKDFVEHRKVLLVLDNFEQVVEAGAPMVSELLAVSPGLHILVTSRAVLHVAGEQEFSVPPLDVPDPHELPPTRLLGQIEAIALFVQRARAVAPDFSVTDDNAGAVTEIARRLDGLPLAIELAAARVKLLSPAAILDRLERRLPVLTTAARDVPARQRTLHDAIEWSYDLLEPAEQRLLARLSAFAGGWTLDAAEAVHNPGREPGIDMLDGLSSLVDKSLVRPLADDATEAPAEPRFSMLQVIREFAAEKLDEDPDAESIRRRHATWVLRLAETARPELRRSDLRRWQHLLRRDEENLRTALRWAIERGEAEIGLRTASAVWDFWHYWAEVREGIAWLESLLALPAAAAPTDARAGGLDALGGLVYWQGKVDRAWDLYDEAVGIRRQLGDEHAIADALFATAWAAAAAYDTHRAIARATEARDLYEASGDPTGVQLTNDWIVIEPAILGGEGDPKAAIAAIEHAHVTTKAIGRVHDATDWLNAWALLHCVHKDPENGLPLARQTIAAWYELGNLGRLPLALKVIAKLELQAGEPWRAVRIEAAAQRLIEDVGGDLYQVFGQLGDTIEEARPLLDPNEHARAIEEGRTRNLAEQVDFALRRRDGG